jgi:hypothetical protein
LNLGGRAVTGGERTPGNPRKCPGCFSPTEKEYGVFGNCGFPVYIYCDIAALQFEEEKARTVCLKTFPDMSNPYC